MNRRRRQIAVAVAVTIACLLIVAAGVCIGFFAWVVYSMSQLH